MYDYAMHSMKGTSEPFKSMIPTMILSLPGCLYWGYRKRREIEMLWENLGEEYQLIILWYLSSEKITWSNTFRFIKSPASPDFSVMVMSSPEGSKSPEYLFNLS